MFTKNKVSQSMIDAVNKVLDEEPTKQEDVLLNEAMAPIKEPTSTGVKVFGRSYGNSAKAKQDQTKSSVDTLKGPKDKEMKEAAKPDFLDLDKDGDKKEPMKKAVADKKKVAEELKGDQHKIDANKNNKIDAQDFVILRGKKKVKEGREFTEKLLEMVRKSDVPAYLRKAKGDTPLTMVDVKSPKKDTLSAPENLAKARNEEKSCDDEVKKHEKRLHGKDGEVGKHVDKMHKEEIEELDEKNVPNSPEKWAQAKSQAKAKFDVYPSAYANGWASKKYKSMGGTWRTESVEHIEEKKMTDDDMKERERIVKGMKKGLDGFKSRYGKDAKSVMYATATKQAMKEASPPFDGPYTKTPSNTKDKSGAVHTPMSRAKDLAQSALKKIQDKTKIK